MILSHVTPSSNSVSPQSKIKGSVMFNAKSPCLMGRWDLSGGPGQYEQKPFILLEESAEIHFQRAYHSHHCELGENPISVSL